MGWSELRAVHNEYDEDIRAIDESILKLIQERRTLTGDKRYSPPLPLIQEWAARFDMEIPHISWLMHGLGSRNIHSVPGEPGELLKVISLMKKSVVDGYEYQLTHSMQHANGSMVYGEIKRCGNEDAASSIRPRLLLDVVSDTQRYDVQKRGFSGGGGQAQLTFFVVPRLPDDLDSVTFGLVPHGAPSEHRPREVYLDREVGFD